MVGSKRLSSGERRARTAPRPIGAVSELVGAGGRGRTAPAARRPFAADGGAHPTAFALAKGFTYRRAPHESRPSGRYGSDAQNGHIRREGRDGCGDERYRPG